MVAIFKTDLKYLRTPSPNPRVMTKDKTKMRLKPFVNCSKTKTNLLISFCPKVMTKGLDFRPRLR